MHRSFVIVPALALVLSWAVAAGDPAPSASVADKLPRSFFPTTVGTTWVYQQMPFETESTRTITKVEMKDNKTLIHISGVTSRGDVYPADVFDLTPEGFFQSQSILGAYRKPLLRLTLSLDPSWVFDNNVGMKRSAKGWEVVEVPAGKYRAFRVDVSYYHAGQRATEYYVPGIGEVLLTVDGERRRALKSFVLPRGPREGKSL